ncbi:MAG: glutathione S-transferase family protein [Gammaproteobacteria bacterium]
MMTLYDYLPSQNGYKIRLLLSHLGQDYRTEPVSIFEGEGQRPEYLAINPTGAVPAIRLDDGRVLAESNAILSFLAEGTRYYPDDRFLRARIQQWMSFEADYVQATMGSLRYWVMTGKAERRPAQLVDGKRAGGMKAMKILNRQFADRPFITGDDYTIADISLFAYAHLAPEAGIPLDDYPHFVRWVERVRGQPGFLDEIHPYSIDPHSWKELP